MDKIAKTLRERRQKLGLSVRDINEKTKLPVQSIEALEKGDLSYFKEDLSYLKFFVRAYCNELGLDFNEIKGDVFDSVDHFTQAIEQEKLERKKQMEESISKGAYRLKRDSVTMEEEANSKTSKLPKPISKKKVGSSSGRIRKDKIEPSVILLLLLIIGIVTVLAIKVFFPAPATPPAVEDPTVTKPLEPNDDVVAGDDNKEDENKPVFTSTRDDSKLSSMEVQYTIEGFKVGDVVRINTTISQDCWMDFFLNNQSFNEKDWRVYTSTDTITLEFTITNQLDALKLGYGNRLGATSVSINDEEIQLGDLPTAAVRYITLNFVQGE